MENGEWRQVSVGFTERALRLRSIKNFELLQSSFSELKVFNSQFFNSFFIAVSDVIY